MKKKIKGSLKRKFAKIHLILIKLSKYKNLKKKVLALIQKINLL